VFTRLCCHRRIFLNPNTLVNFTLKHIATWGKAQFYSALKFVSEPRTVTVSKRRRKRICYKIIFDLLMLQHIQFQYHVLEWRTVPSPWPTQRINPLRQAQIRQVSCAPWKKKNYNATAQLKNSRSTNNLSTSQLKRVSRRWVRFCIYLIHFEFRV
jgi:hypothetical protein